jgi:hypothetical protein
VLVDELGIEPSRELRELHQAILNQDPVLDLVASPAPERDSARGVFVGREAELAELIAGLDDAVAGHGLLFLLVGEPGIGKSRLADELIVRARARGACVLVGRCWEAGGAPAYWPWVQSMRAYIRETEPETLRSQLGAGAVDLAQVHANELVTRGRHVLADVVGADRQLPVSAVDQDREAHRGGPAVVHQGIHRRPHRAPGVEHVVYDHDRRRGEVKWKVSALDLRLARDAREVVAVEGDIQGPDGDPHALVGFDHVRDPPRQGDAATLDADEGHALGAAVLLDDLMADADESAPHFVGGHDLPRAHQLLLLAGLAGPDRGRSASG